MNDYHVIEQFEREVAEYTNAPFAVAVDSCTAALFLCCKYHDAKKIILPAHTYGSVPATVIHSGAEVEFDDRSWKGEYQLEPQPIWDSALRLTGGMYRPGMMQCLSFQYKKRIPIGRGGMVLTDDVKAKRWLRLARFNGREAYPVGKGRIMFPGWHLFMEPERAARGLILMQGLKYEEPDIEANYADLRQEPAYKKE